MQANKTAFQTAYSAAIQECDDELILAIKQWEHEYAMATVQLQRAAASSDAPILPSAPPSLQERVRTIGTAGLKREMALHLGCLDILERFEVDSIEVKVKKLAIQDAFFRHIETLEAELFDQMLAAGRRACACSHVVECSAARNACHF